VTRHLAAGLPAVPFERSKHGGLARRYISPARATPLCVVSPGGGRMSETETALVLRARDGDRAAFEELVRRTSRLVFARLYLDTGNPDRAEDLLQETLLLAFRSVGRLADPAGFRPWLLAIAHNTLIDAARRDARRKRAVPADADTPADAVPAPGPAPDEAAGREETRHRVLAALRTLPDEYRLPLAMRYLTGADYETIGEQLGLTNGSLRGYLHRGLKMLRDRLPPELHD
jgi:RNA polymerase sigma-70 factor (ECF subfamily)